METWNAKAKCLHDPRITTDFFFPEWDYYTDAFQPPIKAIETYCSTCPVRRECEHEAARNKETEGFWGGKAAAQCKL
jgi:hypothetical protein